jgi:hypothetical protein
VAGSYERARELRAVGEQPDGFTITATRTVNVSVERLYEAFVDDRLRERWLPGAELRLRTATAPRSARYDWKDGSSRIAVAFTRLGEAKSRLALAHERLPDAQRAEQLKSFWREGVSGLKQRLEAPTR